MSDKRGFTLLELLMVVIIIAILASIALPQYINATERARASEALQLLGALRSSELRYAAQNPNNSYTPNAPELDTTITGSANWNPPVINAGGPPPVGFIEVARTGGQFAGQTVGIQLGTGTICGNFTPMALAAGCVPD